MSEFWLADTGSTRRCFRELDAWKLPDVPRDYRTFLATPFPVEFLSLVENRPTLSGEPADV